MNELFKDTRKLTLLGVMFAITIILDMTPLGNLPIGPVGSTIVHLPTIITGIILGPVAGFIMGTLMGITSLLHALLRPLTPLDPFFVNPLVSVLPRMFIGVSAYYVYTLVKKLVGEKLPGTSISAVLGAVAGSVTNTLLVFLMFYLVYVEDIVELLESFGEEVLGYIPSFNAFFIATATTNGLAEAIAAGVIVPIIVTAYYSYRKTRPSK